MTRSPSARRRRGASVARVQHGTRSAYVNHGCRCDECRAENAAYFRDRRLGTRYDVAALEAAVGGASSRELAERLGIRPDTVRRARSRGLSEKTADRWAVACGLTPFEVWPEWLADAEVPCVECGGMFVPFRKGHIYCKRACTKRANDRDAKRRRYQSDPEWAQRERDRSRRYRQEADRALKAKGARYREENREALAERARAYYAANRERIKAKERERYHARRNQQADPGGPQRSSAEVAA